MAGGYSLSAQATDNGGAVTTSSPAVAVTVAVVEPAVCFLLPPTPAPGSVP